MSRIGEALSAAGLPAATCTTCRRPQSDSPTARNTGSRSREGPRCLEAVLEVAGRLEVAVHRVSQGSGVFMLTEPGSTRSRTSALRTALR
jgi:hypothetical protein